MTPALAVEKKCSLISNMTTPTYTIHPINAMAVTSTKIRPTRLEKEQIEAERGFVVLQGLLSCDQVLSNDTSDVCSVGSAWFSLHNILNQHGTTHPNPNALVSLLMGSMALCSTELSELTARFKPPSTTKVD